MQNQDEILTAIAKDLDLCDLGIALTKGRLRQRYIAHRKARMAAIREINPMPENVDLDELRVELEGC